MSLHIGRVSFFRVGVVASTLVVVFSAVGLSLKATRSNSAVASPSCTSCTVTNTTTSQCLNVVQMQLGQTYNLRYAVNGAIQPAPERFSAQFGDYSNSGAYTAPSTLPPMGLDFITIYDSSGAPDYQIIVQFVPPGGYQYGAENPPLLEGEQTVTVGETVPSGTVTESETQPGEIFPLNDLTSCTTETVAGVSGSSLPISPLDDTSPEADPSTKKVLVVGAMLQKGKKCGVLPRPLEPCNGGTTTVEGPWKIHKKEPKQWVTGTITAGPFQGTYHNWVVSCWKIKFIDHYTCLNGNWKFVKTVKCQQIGSFAWVFQPISISIEHTRQLFGYGADGYQWDPEIQCINQG
jgi:hypothetical protein